MTTFVPVQARMLIAFLGRHRGELLVKAAKSAGARGGTIALGKSINDSKFLQALSLADVHQDVVFMVMGREADNIIAGIKAVAGHERKRLAGLAVVLDVPDMYLREQKTTESVRLRKARSNVMQSGYTLMNVIVNAGFADDVMAVAKKAGAAGGTILVARGTGTEEDVKFFGITLVPEKEMLLIVAANDLVKPIVSAINSIPELAKPGGGIVFTMNVEEFIPLGNMKE